MKDRKHKIIFSDTAPLKLCIGLNQVFKQYQFQFSDPASTLNRLRKFFELFLSNGLNSEFAYQFGLKDA